MTPKKTPRGAAMTTMKGPSMRYRWAARVIPPVQFTRGEWRVVHALTALMRTANSTGDAPSLKPRPGSPIPSSAMPSGNCGGTGLIRAQQNRLRHNGECDILSLTLPDDEGAL